MSLIHPAGRHGLLELALEVRDSRTVAARCHSRVPFQVMKPITDASGTLCVYLLSPTGGVLQGDRYEGNIRLAPESHALLTTPAATKIYRMPDGAAVSRMNFRSERDSLCEYLPEATILFAESDYSQEHRIHLETGARFVFQEILVPGRIGSGEAFAFRRYRSLMEVRDADGLLLGDAYTLNPTQSNAYGIGILDGFSCWGTWLLCGLTPTDAEWDALCERFDPFLTQPGESVGGMSRLHRNGFLVRMLAHRAHVIETAFRRIWDETRQRLLGLKETSLRKY